MPPPVRNKKCITRLELNDSRSGQCLPKSRVALKIGVLQRYHADGHAGRGDVHRPRIEIGQLFGWEQGKAAATGEHKSGHDTAEWLSVYEDFIRTKKQCGEATDGLTFEKFSHTLKKNRDALIARHGCKRVKFSVYVKEGRASLKATPVKD